jgi:hypothetical protein
MYQAIIDSNILPHNIYLWKLKLPLKVKVFLWLLYRKVILTKDNLVKRNWHGDINMLFFNNHETIHISLQIVSWLIMWRVIHLAFVIGPPSSINQMFGIWVINMNNNKRILYPVSIGTMLWAVWLDLTNIVFEISPDFSYMQVIFRGTH